uniref:Autophagy-related protein 9 n=1 Tax=Plectus sambesii TaxID=2011161 RepID=A0A914UL79_9BILA
MGKKKDKASYYQIIDDDTESAPPQAFLSFPAPDDAGTSSVTAEPSALRGDLFGGPPQSHEILIQDPAEGEPSNGLKTSNRHRRRWDHIENLDQFFTRVYEYHQRGGFWCMFSSELFSLFQFIFVVCFTTFLLQCVDYDILFKNKLINRNKTTIADALIESCASQFHPFIVLALLLAAVFWVFRAVRLMYQMIQHREISNFYNNALKISSQDLDNMTWHEVLQRLRQMQPELELIINRSELTELDVYQRILRHKNYLVAMVNKGMLPVKFELPFVGQVSFLSNGFKLNLEWILFSGPWSPWKGPYALRDEYKNREYLADLAVQMDSIIFWTGVANLVLFPVIFLYQILYSFFSYAELIKREPGALGMRRYSNYGRYYLRHFNELDHELKMRLNRGYRPASQYMDMFVSRSAEIIAKNIAFVAGAFFAVLAVLSAWDEDVLQIEHVLTAMTVCGVIVVGCRVFIADENLVWCPEWLMNMIVAQVHYIPDSWKGHAHTDRVRQEFSQLFQFKVYYLLEELFSPVITPLALIFWVRPRARELVDFFHRFTVDVEGLGDVCSFAQMDIRKHGDPKWNGAEQDTQAADPVERVENRANGGKIEMSLIHFTLTNPVWEPPMDAAQFLNRLRENAERDLDHMKENQAVLGADNALLQSLTSLVPLQYPFQMSRLGVAQKVRGQGISQMEGPLRTSSSAQKPSSLLASLQQSGLLDHSVLGGSVMGASGVQQSLSSALPVAPILDGAAAEMSLHALYLHELHGQRSRLRDYGSMTFNQSTPSHQPPSSTTRDDRQLWAVPEHSMMARGGRLHLVDESTNERDEDDAPSVFRSS